MNIPANRRRPSQEIRPDHLTPILILEVNEVPWAVIDKFVKDERFSNLKAFFENCRTYTTIAEDTGELSPWVTWPTFYRGMNNEAHKVQFLGQDPSTFQGKPLWDEFLERRQSVGICGTLQSWPPKNPGYGGFYIPDTFAHDAKCIPKSVEPFQEFNLSQVKANARVVQSRTWLNLKAVKLILSLPKIGIRVRTIFKLVSHVLGELIDKKRYCARRPIYQAVMMWDVFGKLFDPKSPPALSTFFTNHVAGAMHRYWHHVFPEHFSKDMHLTKDHDAFEFAMLELDKILGDAMNFTKINPRIRIVFASSMGQGPVEKLKHNGFEPVITDVKKLLSVAGIHENDFTQNLAMVPQVAVEFRDSMKADRAEAYLKTLVSASEKEFIRVSRADNSLSITVLNPGDADLKAGFAKSNANPIAFEECGIKVYAVDSGTAYHIREGVLAVYTPYAPGVDTREAMPATAVKGFLMDLAGLSR